MLVYTTLTELFSCAAELYIQPAFRSNFSTCYCFDLWYCLPTGSNNGANQMNFSLKISGRRAVRMFDCAEAAIAAGRKSGKSFQVCEYSVYGPRCGCPEVVHAE